MLTGVAIMGACGADDWPREAVNLEVDLPLSIDGWEPISNTECLFTGEPLMFEPTAAGKNVLDRGPEAADREHQALEGDSGVLVGDACRMVVRFGVTTRSTLVVEVSRDGEILDSLDTAAVLDEYHESIEWSPGSPWRLGG